MSEQKLILTDVDGVLCDWVTSFRAWIDDYHPELVSVNNWRDIYMIHDWYGLEQQDGHNLVSEFNLAPAIEYMGAAPNAIEYVRKLHSEHDYDFVAITAMGTSQDSFNRRLKNLKNLFGEAIVKLEVTPLHDDKSANLKQYEKAIWVEDKPRNAEVGHDLGHRTFLVKHDHNRGDTVKPGITAVTDWKEIYDHITREQE